MLLRPSKLSILYSKYSKPVRETSANSQHQHLWVYSNLNVLFNIVLEIKAFNFLTVLLLFFFVGGMETQAN